ncbi:ABC transporter permease [Cohnella hongkongensis]|uniref:ABC transporter permease n=1 Tax=Cohnella hongkongensis TaxID=178337 RepID=A0ABV9FJ18_9BACL
MSKLQSSSISDAGQASRIRSILKTPESGIFLVLLAICVLLTIVRPNFADSYNLGILVRQFSFVAIVALGQTLVLLKGGIDLSVGAVAGLSGILSSWLMINSGINPYICVLIGILIGAVCGAINGLFITKFNLNPFIVTLATGEIFAGFILVITKGWAIRNLPESVLYLGQGMIGPIPVPFIIMIVLTVIFMYLLKNTPFGRYIYAIGGNESAARLVGIKIDKVKISVYAISGALAALAGIIMATRLAAGQPTIGDGWLMASITAAIIGGTSLNGGEGRVIGSVIGAALMGVLANAIVLLSISAYWERVIIGLVVLAAIVLDRVRARLNRN